MTIRLSQLQHNIVAHDDGALLVVAGPGSGKTRVVTERIRRLLKIPKQHFRILALTFTNKAANEMVERLEDVDEVRTRAFVGTMHSFCTEVLENRGKSVGITGLPNIFESFQDRKQVLADAVQSDPEMTRALQEAGSPKEQNQQLDRWLNAIGEAKNSLLFPGMIQDALLRRLYEAYDSALRACGAVDFDDLLLLTYRLFEERPEIAAFYRRQYRYICVDEAQDLNESQYRILCALCGKQYFNILMVGDPKQAIYVWNGASPRYMDLFVQDFNAVRIELNENFRSSRSVVAAAQALDTAYTVGGQLAVEGQVSIQECATEEEEAEFLVDEVTRLIATGHPDVEGDITAERCGVLGRNRFVFRALEPLLVEHGIAFHKKVSAATYESESDVMEEFELALRVLSNPLDRLHLGELNSLWKSASNVDAIYRGHDLRTVTGLAILEKLCTDAKAGHCASTMNAVRALRWTPEDFRFLKGLESIEAASASLSDDERALLLQDLAEWRKHWNYFVRSVPGGRQSVPLFLNQVALGTTQQPSQDGLSLLTVHSAKGMEFDVVFVIGMAEGTFPDYRAKGETMREERRNAFVAVTRSRRILYLTWPKVKEMPWGDLRTQEPSRFIREVQASAQ
jgi:DNA helicase-2/ATP-dependent DNA helicase PcrA